MTPLTTNHFDLLEYVKKSKELGVSEELAEYQARQIEQSISIAVNQVRIEIENKELATKKDIESVRKDIETVRKEIAEASNKIIIWLGGLLIASGILQHFFK